MQNSYPYNEKNILLKSSHIENILIKFNIKIKINNLHYFQQAFTHKSYLKKEYSTILNNNNYVELQDNSNERLEFLGDTIIKACIARYLFLRYYEEDEGFMTRLKTKLEDTLTLSKFAKRLGLEVYILISKQIEENNNGRYALKLLEDTFEAFMGALFLDQDFYICNQLIFALLESEIDYAEILANDTNYKDRLLRFYHSNKWSFPIYICLKEELVINKKMYTMGVQDYQGNIITTAIDTSKKRAEQKCARIALIKFNQLDEKIEQDI
jgi:ribonuclease-3